MKKLLVVLFIFICGLPYSQEFLFTEFYVCKRKSEAKRIEKRFDKAVIGKDIIIGEDKFYYIELEENDREEYYYSFLFKFKMYCIPKRKRKKIQSIIIWDDKISWDDEKIKL